MAAMTQMTSSQLLGQRLTRTPARFTSAAARPSLRSRTFVVRAAEKGNLDEDSYQKIEAPVRSAPSDGGPSIRDRETEFDREIVTSQGNKEKEILGTEVSIADAFRFKGALPEVANCRLAMLGFVAALGYEAVSGNSLAVQIKQAPLLIAATFLTFIIATLVPILRGVPRRDSSEMGGLPGFTAEGEILVGRTAMIGFLGLVITEALKGGPLIG
jgi:hypothetical protein